MTVSAEVRWRDIDPDDAVRRRLQLVWCVAGSHYYWRAWSLSGSPYVTCPHPIGPVSDADPTTPQGD